MYVLIKILGHTLTHFPSMVAAAEMNKNLNFSTLRVYGLLTNLNVFQFYSYNPLTNSFFFDEEFLTNSRRDDFCFDMIYGKIKAIGHIREFTDGFWFQWRTNYLV